MSVRDDPSLKKSTRLSGSQVVYRSCFAFCFPARRFGFMAYRTTEVYTCVAYLFLSAICCALVSYRGLESKIYYLCDSRTVSSHGLKNENIYHVYRACFKERVYVPRLACLLRFMTKKNEVFSRLKKGLKRSTSFFQAAREKGKYAIYVPHQRVWF